MELILAEGKVYGARYYTVHPQVPEMMYHQIQQSWLDMTVWCVETFGPAPENGVFEPGGRWYANNAKFWFRERKDLEWFIIRWQ
jgi:hypothetical protein